VWSGGPHEAERTNRIATVDRIVTLSAPFCGTPIADHIRLEATVLLELVQAFTMLGIFRSNTVDESAIPFLAQVLAGQPTVMATGALVGTALRALIMRLKPNARDVPPP
jgi:hypothetical protein